MVAGPGRVIVADEDEADDMDEAIDEAACKAAAGRWMELNFEAVAGLGSADGRAGIRDD